MKPRPLFLALSLAANAVLAVALLLAVRSQPPAPSAADPALAPASRAHSAARASAPAATDDLPALVAQLRAAGFSAAVVRAAILERVREIFAAKRRALEPDGDLPYWKTDTRRRDRTLEQMVAIRATWREQDDLLKKLLGPDALDADAQAVQRQRYGSLSPEKIAGIERLRRDYGDLMDEVQQLSRGAMLPEDREKLAYLAREERADLMKLLTPQELEDYDLRNNATATRLRGQLVGFNPTEQEFRTLFALQRAFDEQFGGRVDTSSPEAGRRLADLRQKLAEQIRAALGPDRFADYERSSDPGFQQASQLVARLELPPAVAVQVWTVQRDIQPRARSIASNPALAPDDRNAQLAALAAEAQTKITAALGTRGFEAYKQSGGAWLQTLQPRPPPPRP